MGDSRSLALALMFILSLGGIVKSIEASSMMQHEEAKYVAAFPKIIEDSFSAPLPTGASSCANEGNAGSLTQVLLSGGDRLTSIELQNQCSTSSLCIVPEGVVVELSSNVNG